jgi:hypothetical protein
MTMLKGLPVWANGAKTSDRLKTLIVEMSMGGMT